MLYCEQTIKTRKPPKQRECQAGASNVEDLTFTDSPLSVVSTSVSDEPADHTYHTKDSSRTVKRKLDNVIERAEVVKNRLEYCNTRVMRLKIEIQSLKTVVADLKEEAYDLR